MKKVHLTPTELAQLKKILLDYGYIENIDYKQENEIDETKKGSQQVIFSGNYYMLDKISSYLRYYVYCFRKKGE